MCSPALQTAPRSSPAWTRGFERLRETGAPFAVLFLDLDGFKRSTTSSGTRLGDAVLQAFSERLRRQARPHDLVGRIGGDEFVVLLTTSRTRHMHRRLRVASATRPQRRSRSGRQASPSEQASGLPMRAGRHCGSILSAADSVMYEAKKLGGTASGRPL